MKIEVKLAPDEKKMVKEYLDSINYGQITNGGQWKLTKWGRIIGVWSNNSTGGK